LAQNGASVFLCDVNDQAGHSIVAKLSEDGFAARYVHTDVSDWESHLAAFNDAGRVDIVVLAAGLGGGDTRSWLKSTGEDAETATRPPKPPIDTLMVNFTGVYYGMNLALHNFKIHATEQPHSTFKPQLLFVSSLNGYEAAPFETDYVASKWGVRGMWKAIRRPADGLPEYQANLLAPTYVATAMIAQIVEPLEQAGVKVASVDDVVAAAMRCVCDDAVEGEKAGGGFVLERT